MGTCSLRCLGLALPVFLAVVLLASPALAQTGRITGTVTDEDGNPVPGATVTAENPDASPPQLVEATDSSGRFSLIGLRSGEWTFIIEAEGFGRNPGPVRISSGNNRALTISMKRLRHSLEIALGEEALEGLDPEAIQAEIDAADAAFNSQQWAQAVTGFRSVLAQVPAMNSLHVQIGNALREMEEYEEAIASFERALAGDPGMEAQIATDIARTRMAMGDFEAAGAGLADAAAGDNASREDLYNLGELEFAKGDVDAAATWYERAAAAAPNWGKPLFKLALVALNQGDIETAKTFLSQVVEKDPNSDEGAQAQATLDALP